VSFIPFVFSFVNFFDNLRLCASGFKKNTNCNTKEIFQHFIDYNLFRTDSQNILSETIFSGD